MKRKKGVDVVKMGNTIPGCTGLFLRGYFRCSNSRWRTSLHYRPVGLDRYRLWISETEEFGWTLTVGSHFLIIASVTALSPHRRHKTPLLSASEWVRELEDRKVWRERRCENKSRVWTCSCTSSTNLESRDQWSAEPTAPSLLLFSESRTDSDSRNTSLFCFLNTPLFFILTSFVLTCSGCIPEAMRSLIIRAWARFCGSAGSKRGPGRVSSIYWITANCARSQFSIVLLTNMI